MSRWIFMIPSEAKCRYGEACADGQGHNLITLGSLPCTPAHTSIRRCIITVRPYTLDLLLNYASYFVVSSTEVGSVRWPQISYEYYCTFGVEHIEWRTNCLGKHNMHGRSQPQKIYENRYCGIAAYLTKSLQTSGKPIILFISSRLTNWPVLIITCSLEQF